MARQADSTRTLAGIVCEARQLRLLVRKVDHARPESENETTHPEGPHRSTVAFSLEIKELGITAPEFKELFVSSLLSNLTVV